MIGSHHLNVIYTGDTQLLTQGIPDQSIDLIFTDPPYPKEFLYLYEWLAAEAPRILKPDSFLLVYVGVYWKDEIMQMMRQKLKFFWDFALHGGGNGPMIWNRRIISNYKSILAYQLPGSNATPWCNVIGCYTGTGQDKRYHVWGQDESSARYYIDCFCPKTDAVVFDPFCGGGTTPAVCKILERPYLAFEKDPATADIARARVESQQMPLFNMSVHAQGEIEL